MKTTMAGRPTKYDHKFSKQVEKLCRLGATDKEIATFFEVNEDTIHEWKRKHPEFSESIKRGKTLADIRVAESLYKKATGFSRKSVKIFNNAGVPMIVSFNEYFPPDTTACIFWLKNRQKENWRDKQHFEIDYDQLTEDQLDAIIEKIINKKK
jgi:hypothetical protein